MGLKVRWTTAAIQHLDMIFDYYKFKANISTARNIIEKLVDRTIQLEEFPLTGKIEELLKNRGKAYRYLIEGNYKIVYWVDSESVTIAAVFDTRRNPKVLKKLTE